MARRDLREWLRTTRDGEEAVVEWALECLSDRDRQWLSDHWGVTARTVDSEMDAANRMYLGVE